MVEPARHYTGAVSTDQAYEIAVAHAMLKDPKRVPTAAVRIYRPSSPAVVFSRRDTRAPGFRRAVQAADAAGFQTAVRAVGGRAVAYTTDTVVVDQVGREPQALARQERRFEEFGTAFARTFAQLGVDARVGPVPGEYCPGAHSVNAGGARKLVGTAQRVLSSAWLFSSLVICGGTEVIAPVLTDVYAALDQPFDAASVGSLTDEVPGLTVTDVEAALVRLYAGPVASSYELLPLAPMTDDFIAAHRTA